MPDIEPKASISCQAGVRGGERAFSYSIENCRPARGNVFAPLVKELDKRVRADPLLVFQFASDLRCRDWAIHVELLDEFWGTISAGHHPTAGACIATFYVCRVLDSPAFSRWTALVATTCTDLLERSQAFPLIVCTIFVASGVRAGRLATQLPVWYSEPALPLGPA